METKTIAPKMADQPYGAPRVNWTPIVLFVVLAFGLSWLVWLGLRVLGMPFPIYAAAGMFGPALAAVVMRLWRKEGFADAGLRLVGRGHRGGGWMYLAAYVAPPLLVAAGLLLSLLLGYQHWAFGQNMQAQAQAMVQALHQQGAKLPAGFTAEQLALLSVVIQSVLAFTLAIPVNMLFTFGEEFGWRGYLLPKLAPLGGVGAAIMTGLLWGLWHAPVIVLDGYNYPGYPLPGVLLMVVSTVALGVIFAWLRFRSGSIWPSTLAHAALNAQAGFALLVLSPGNPLLCPPLGLIGLAPILAFAIWLIATGRLRVAQAPALEGGTEGRPPVDGAALD